MAYSDFTLQKALADFGLSTEERVDLFPDVPRIEPSEALRSWLDEFALPAISFGSERGRGESIIFPILAEAKRRSTGPVTIAPGVAFDVDRERGLTGYCDYLLTRSRQVYYVSGPVFAAVEAKREDITGGLGQCAAEMVAIRIFNEKNATPVPAVYGCVTSGNLWRFLKLEGTTLYIDKEEHYLSELPLILGILVHIASS